MKPAGTGMNSDTCPEALRGCRGMLLGLVVSLALYGLVAACLFVVWVW